ncbi:transcriptional regulator, LuxR family, putative [Minicystis rosea]|nr:transcriptional regulator, LuxR family, putative [Minicystis rosea]
MLAAAGDGDAEPALVSLALSARCRIQQWSGPEEALADLRRALALAQAAGAPLAEGRALLMSGMFAVWAWKEEAREQLTRALALHRTTGDAISEMCALRYLGVVAGKSGRHDEAAAHLAAAIARGREVGEDEQTAFCLGQLGTLTLDAGQMEAAIARLDEGIALLRSLGAPPYFLCQSGFALQELQRFEEAARRYDEAIDVARSHGRRMSLVVALAYEASLFRERGELEEALRRHRDALSSMEGVVSPETSGFIHASLGALLADLGRIEDAETELAAARQKLATHGDDWRAFAEVSHGHLDLALAAAREAVGDTGEAAVLRARAAARLAADAPTGKQLRFARRLLARALARSTPPPDEEALVVGPEARWFRCGSGPAVDLGRRHAVRLVLWALVRQHLDRPGKALSQDALVRVGWPGEQMGRRAALNRLNVTLSALRKLGLRDRIDNQWNGYQLARRLRVVLADEPTPS